MFGKLVPCGGGPFLPLVKASVVVGRSPDCDLRVVCPTVSGRHCELRFQDGAWSVRDLDSKNGITVNGQKSKEGRLAPDAILGVGRQRFVITYQAAEAKPKAEGEPPNIDDLVMAMLADEAPAPPLRVDAAHGNTSAGTPLPAALRNGLRPELGKLIPCGGGDAIPLLRSELIIGRRPDCDVCLRFPAVSGRHCKLTHQEGYWIVQDLGSSNGTWVDWVRCDRKCLTPNSVLGLAKHRYTVTYTPTGTGPPPLEEEVFAQSLLEKAGLAKLPVGPPTRAKQDEDPADRVRYRLDEQDP